MDAIKISLLFIALVGGASVIRSLSNRQRAYVWIVGLAVVLPFWIHNGLTYHWPWFLWAKIFSIIFACVWAELCATRFRDRPKLVAVSVWIILAANIFEAVAYDLAHHQMINAAAGILLIVSAALAPVAHVERRGRSFEVAFNLGWVWIASYTVWNLCFLYGTTPAILGRNIGLLAAALVLAMTFGQKYWLQLRAYSFGLFCMVVETFYGTFDHWLNTGNWSNPATYSAFATISLAIAITACTVLALGRVARPRHVPA